MLHMDVQGFAVATFSARSGEEEQTGATVEITRPRRGQRESRELLFSLAFVSRSATVCRSRNNVWGY